MPPFPLPVVVVALAVVSYVVHVRSVHVSTRFAYFVSIHPVVFARSLSSCSRVCCRSLCFCVSLMRAFKTGLILCVSSEQFVLLFR